MTGESRRSRRATPAGLGLLVGVGGLVMAGVVGGVVGGFAGVAAARRPQRVFIAAALVLSLTAIFTVLEAPLTEAGAATFPHSHPAAEFAAKVAAVLLLAGLVGTAARYARSTRRAIAEEPVGAPIHEPVPAIMPLLAAALLGGFVLWELGDERWHWAGLALAVVVIALGSLLLLAQRRPSRARR